MPADAQPNVRLAGLDPDRQDASAKPAPPKLEAGERVLFEEHSHLYVRSWLAKCLGASLAHVECQVHVTTNKVVVDYREFAQSELFPQLGRLDLKHRHYALPRSIVRGVEAGTGLPLLARARRALWFVVIGTLLLTQAWRHVPDAARTAFRLAKPLHCTGPCRLLVEQLEALEQHAAPGVLPDGVPHGGTPDDTPPQWYVRRKAEERAARGDVDGDAPDAKASVSVLEGAVVPGPSGARPERGAGARETAQRDPGGARSSAAATVELASGLSAAGSSGLSSRAHVVPLGANATLRAERPARRHRCEDLGFWVDAEGNPCQRYAEPGWVHSCAGGSGPPRKETDELALEFAEDPLVVVSALDACCVCGGGRREARRKAAKALARSLEAPVREAGAALGKALPAAGLRAAIAEELEVLPDGDLLGAHDPQWLAGLLAPDASGSADADPLARLGRVGQGATRQDALLLAVELANSPEGRQVRAQLGEQLDVATGAATSAMSVVPLLVWVVWLCCLHLLGLVLVISGLLQLGAWYALYKTKWSFVSLKLHRDFWGPDQSASKWNFFGGGWRDKEPGRVGFYLAEREDSRDRLHELSHALFHGGEPAAG